MKGHCTKCNVEAEILAGHVGKKHRACQGKKKGDSHCKANSGTWMVGHAPRGK